MSLDGFDDPRDYGSEEEDERSMRLVVGPPPFVRTAAEWREYLDGEITADELRARRSREEITNGCD